MTTPQPKLVGRSVYRKEDGPLLRGLGRFAADINFPNQLHMRVVRSTYAHGRIVSVDLAPALAMPGVHAAWSFADVADIPPIDFRLTRLEQLAAYRQTILARDRVRYVGDPVAVIFADDAYRAEDAAESVVVVIDELPVILHADQATGEFADGISTECGIIRKEYGDVEAALKAAHAVVSLSLNIGRHSGVPIETRGAIARYDAASDMLELYGAAKVPHWNRNQIARMLGRPPASVNLFEGHVGGGFGVRGELYPEDVLVCVAALRLRRPVKWIEDRREHLIATNHSRQQTHHIRGAIDREGRILAIDNAFFS
jgi:carbon-monoxide dehydrogenase large subunit